MLVEVAGEAQALTAYLASAETAEQALVAKLS